MTKLRTAEEARAELERQGISVSKWATAHGFTTNLVYEVLSGKRACKFGQSHQIAVALGIKAGEVCLDPRKALSNKTSRIAPSSAVA
ncbi:DNA-binding protein [Azoarcus communis]|uniref:DNA-binding protein n=1 Tax=Parazoarcus communis TaxID=41977 RepID=UPI001459D8D6|nr:DNA-binding protein [Parazoarcus communis]NMG48271.1 DNA-binding protein [Parazoarcus communis]